jgi:hypothetical protein
MGRASFLVSPKVAVYQFSTISQVLHKKARVCVLEGAAIQRILGSTYSDLIMVGKDSEADIFHGLRKPIGKGGCQAVIHEYNSFEQYEHSKDVNYDCGISSEKRVVTNLPAGMATIVDNGPASAANDDDDSQYKCTSLITHVLDYHLTTMQDDGFLEEAWRKHLQRTATVECISEPTGFDIGLEETVSLTVADVGGIFIVHAVLSCLAVALATYQFYMKARRKQIDDDRTLRTVFGVHHVQSIARMKGFQTSNNQSVLPTIPEDNSNSQNPEGKRTGMQEEGTTRDSSTTRNTSHHFDDEAGSDELAPAAQTCDLSRITNEPSA